MPLRPCGGLRISAGANSLDAHRRQEAHRARGGRPLGGESADPIAPVNAAIGLPERGREAVSPRPQGRIVAL
jgi:hypothetical protein